MKIAEIDRNFYVASSLDKNGIRFYNALQEPIQVYGVFMENGKFRRLPEKTAESVSQGVYALHANTAGGRVRFRTDSPFVAISAQMENIGKMSHFALTGSAGFDLYETIDGIETYCCTFTPPFDQETGYESKRELGSQKMREITIHFPLYSDVKCLQIGLHPQASVEPASAYRISAPVVYYGSSITQGGCASRPGNSYQAMISRRLHCDYVNLGFSGSAMAETEMTSYIASLQMSCFVMDYDHNAPTVEYLRETHERMFRTIRAAHPVLPIVLMSRPKARLTAEECERLEVIRQTYHHALAAGDQSVYLLDGKDLTALCGNEGTVDNSHPTDFGFASMAQALGNLLETIGIFRNAVG